MISSAARLSIEFTVRQNNSRYQEARCVLHAGCLYENVKVFILTPGEGSRLSLSANLIIYLCGTKTDIEYFMGKKHLL